MIDIPACHGPQTQAPAHFRLRLALFLSITVLVLGTAGWLLREHLPLPEPNVDLSMQLTMAGFQPENLTVPAGKPYTIRLVNGDSPYHTGGGEHQFAVPELGIDVRVAPHETKIITVPTLAAGQYQFYCDVCCGGKESPGMQGILYVN